MGVRLESVPQIVSDKQVEPSIPIDIYERRRHTPGAIVDNARGLRDVGERAVAVVVEQLASSETRSKDVDAAVVVEIPRGHSHAVSRRVDAARLSHVGEMQGSSAVSAHDQIVSVQPIAKRRLTLWGWKERLSERLARSQHLALDEVDVQIAVVVVVEESHAGPEDLGHIQLA